MFHVAPSPAGVQPLRHGHSHGECLTPGCRAGQTAGRRSLQRKEAAGTGRGARRGLGPEWMAKGAELVLERMSTGGGGGGGRVKPPMGHGSGDGSFLMLRPWNPKGGYTGWELCRSAVILIWRVNISLLGGKTTEPIPSGAK